MNILKKVEKVVSNSDFQNNESRSETIERIAKDLENLDFILREFYITYVVKLESHLRGIYWFNKTQKFEQDSKVNASLNQITKDFANNYILYKKDLIELFEKNIDIKNSHKIDDSNILMILDLFRWSRNFIVHGEKDIFSAKVTVKMVADSTQNVNNISERRNIDKNFEKFQNLFNKKFFFNIGGYNDDRNLLSTIILVVAKSNPNFIARSILCKMDETIKKHYIKTSNLWKKGDFYKMISLKENWIDELI